MNRTRRRRQPVLLLTAICGGFTLGMIVVLVRRRRRSRGNVSTEEVATPRRSWTTIRLATILVFLTIFAGLTVYTGSYYVLSRRGIEERQMDMQGWLYISYGEYLQDVCRGRPTSLHRHDWCERLFRPLNWLDHRLFGTPRSANSKEW